MLAIVIRTEADERYERASAERLAELVRRLGGRKDRFLVLERVPDEADFYAQVWHEGEGPYQVEYRDGSAGRHFQAHTGDAEAVIATLTDWARRAPGWGAALTWTPLDLGAPADEPSAPDLSAEDRAELEGAVRVALHGGYRDAPALAELAEEYLATDERRPVSAAWARALVDRLWRERLAEQEDWHGETDPERLTRAFTALEAAGVVAREDFACCRSCGMREIGAEAGPRGARGFVFFHGQCTDDAVTGGGLRLYYGGFDEEERTTAAIGREVVAALAAAGLRTRWDGSPARAIEVTPLDWRRRLPVG